MPNYAEIVVEFLKPKRNIWFNKMTAMDEIPHHRTNIGNVVLWWGMRNEDFVNIDPKTRKPRKWGLNNSDKMFSIS